MRRLAMLITVSGLVLLGGTSNRGFAVTPDDKSFAAWCANRSRLPAAVKNTVEVLLEAVETSECDRAQTELLSLTKLSLREQSIQSLEPLSSLTQLTELELSDNQIVDLSPLSSLANLTFLNLSNNQIQEVRPLTPLTQLKYLYLDGNQVRDPSPLGTLSNLEALYLTGNQIETVNLPSLANLKNLIVFRLRDNPIREKICPLSPGIVCHFDDEGEDLTARAAEQVGQENLRGAIATLQEALALYQETRNLQQQGFVLNWMGDLDSQIGNYAQTLASYQRSLQVYRQLEDRIGMIIAETNLAEIRDRLGQYEIALQHLGQASQIIEDLNRQSVGKDRELAILANSRWGETPEEYHINIYHNRSLIYDKLGNYPEALKAAQLALELSTTYNEGGYSFEVDIALSLDEIGIAHLRLGNFSAALDSFNKALAAIKNNQFLQHESQATLRKQLEGRILGHLGELRTQQRKVVEAVELYEQSLALRRQVGDRVGEGETLHRLGSLMLDQAHFDLAAKYLFAAVEIWESTRSRLADETKIALIETQEETYRLLQQALVGQNKPDAALEVAERSRARAFVELLRQRLENVRPQSQMRPPTLKQSQQIAREQNATLVEYSAIADTLLYIWVVQPTGEVSFRYVDTTTEATSLPKLVRNNRYSLGDRSRSLVSVRPAEVGESSDLEASARSLYSILIEPIADLLPTHSNSPVIFIPHQDLFLVPFPALVDAEGQFLIEKHAILTAPSIQVLQLTRQQRERIDSRSEANPLIVGNPTMPSITLKIGDTPQKLPQLPGAEREANAIAQLLNTNAIAGDAATETAVRSKIESASLIHFATHGLLDYGQLQGEVRLDIPGALAFAPSAGGADNDGLLTAREIFDLNLNANLVVLSACDTGRGEITSDGVIGLSRAFISAGTPSIIVSLWSVPDAPTADLMAEFYRQWQGSENKAQALRQAMLKTKEQYPDPRDWAAFTLVGEME